MNSSQIDPKILYQLSWYSNLVSIFDPGSDPAGLLYEKILAALKQNESAIGKWNVVWGPLVVVPSDISKYPINAMYVAESAADPSQLVVAIAGTNGFSVLNLLLEDFLVSNQVPWPFDTTGESAISLSTAIGVGILLTLSPSGDRPAAGQKLLDFLFRRAITQKLNITTVGHSLGGALAPTIGLALANLEAWDPFKRAQVTSVPTAGPTPGNQAFATFMDSHLAVQRYHNTLDAVPHAWNLTDLGQIPNLYENSSPKNIPPDPFIQFLVGIAQGAAKDGNYTHPGTSEPIPGTVDQEIITGFRAFDFVRQVGYQHVAAYDEYFAIPGVVKPEVQFLPFAAPISTTTAAIAASRASSIPAEPAGAFTVPLADHTLEVPTSPNDPRAAEVVRTVQEELERIANWRPQSNAASA